MAERNVGTVKAPSAIVQIVANIQSARLSVYHSFEVT